MAKKKNRYRNAGKAYTQDEIDELYLLAHEEGARQFDRREPVADHYGRSEDGVDMVYRWAQGGRFPARANGQIRRQVQETIRRMKNDPEHEARVRRRLVQAGLLEA